MVVLVPELWNRKSNDGREAVAVGEMTVAMVYPKAPENESYSRWSLAGDEWRWLIWEQLEAARNGCGGDCSEVYLSGIVEPETAATTGYQSNDWSLFFKQGFQWVPELGWTEEIGATPKKGLQNVRDDR